MYFTQSLELENVQMIDKLLFKVMTLCKHDICLHTDEVKATFTYQTVRLII